jgi:hypothetical protein
MNQALQRLEERLIAEYKAEDDPAKAEQLLDTIAAVHDVMAARRPKPLADLVQQLHDAGRRKETDHAQPERD